MALSANEATTIQNRFLAIERKLNEIQVALNNLATKAQSKSLLNIRQNEIIEIQETLEHLQRVNGAILVDIHEADSDAHASIFADYYKKGNFVDSTTGVIDAGKPLKLDSTGKLDPSLVELSFEDHSTLSGLDSDDHTQYHTDGRANTWLATKDTDNLSEGTNLYYTEARVSANSDVSANTAVRHSHSNKAQLDLVTDGDHDIRTDVHFTEASIDHGSVSGLNDDDHTHYSLVDGSRAFTGTVAGVSPVSSSDLATKEYVDNAVTEVIYVGDSVILNNGVLDSGNLASTQTIDDSDTYNVSEVTGVPGFNIEFTFSSVETFDYVRVHAQYTGSPSHSVLVQLYNYNTTSWDTKATVEPVGTFQYINQAIASDVNYIDGSGNTRLRIYHETNGNTSHDILVDYIVLSKQGIGYTTDHGGLTGLLDDDHTIYHTDARGDVRYYLQSQVDIFLAGKSDTGHTHHDLYYTEAEVDTLLSGYSEITHLHDDRYYTESETNSLLSSKSDTSHLHDDRYYTETEIDTLLTSYTVTGHLHNDIYYTESEVDASLATKSDVGHNHDSSYYTQGQIDSTVTGLAPYFHQHNDLYYQESEIDALLANKSNTSHLHDDRYYTETELNAGQLDNRYYTESETNTLLSGVNHGDLEGLNTDDHTQYLLANGSRRVTGNFNIDGNLTFHTDTSDDVNIGTGGGNIVFVDPIVVGIQQFTEDTGPTNLYLYPVSSTPSAGDEMSVALPIDSVTIATIYAQADGTGGIQAPSLKMGAARFQGSKGSDVASADEITLGDGNYFDITGTTTINHINKTNWQAGSVVTLQFDASVTVTYNAASPTGTEASILLAGASNFNATANDTLTLIYDGVTWREISRTVI